MWSVFKKDFFSFAASFSGLIVGVVFLLILSLFLWFIEGGYNILYSGLAELTSYFELVPWLLMFVVPAISMRSFSEEYRSGTIEIILTKPVKTREVVLAKFLAVWLSVIIILLPTLVYYYSVESLAMPGYGPDTGVVLSGFSGLFLLSAVFSALGVMVSASTSSQMGAYLGTVFIIFLLYYGLFGLGNFNLFGQYDYLIRRFALMPHFQDLIKGLISLSTLFYLLAWIFIAWGITGILVERNKAG